MSELPSSPLPGPCGWRHLVVQGSNGQPSLLVLPPAGRQWSRCIPTWLGFYSPTSLLSSRQGSRLLQEGRCGHCADWVAPWLRLHQHHACSPCAMMGPRAPPPAPAPSPFPAPPSIRAAVLVVLTWGCSVALVGRAQGKKINASETWLFLRPWVM